MLPGKADVVVIGGGVIGASISYHLSRRKLKVVLLEQGVPAGGSSGACDGTIFLQTKNPGPNLKLAKFNPDNCNLEPITLNSI